MSVGFLSKARATAMNYDVVTLKRHLNLWVSTTLNFTRFFTILLMLTIINYCSSLIFSLFFHRNLLCIFILLNDLVPSNKTPKLVIFSKQFLVRFLSSLKLYFEGRLNDNIVPCIFSFLILLICLNFCLRCQAVTMDFMLKILSTTCENCNEITILVLVGPLSNYGLNSV